MSELETTRRRAPGRRAGVAAAVLATGALACGVCCALPFALPAAALALSGGALAWLGRAYGVMTLVAAAAVLGAWAWVGWRSFQSDGRPARATLVSLALGTAMLAAALAWPSVEPVVTGLFRTSGR